MSRILMSALSLSVRFPRVSGDEPVAKRDRKRRPEFSPRERG